MAMAGGRARGGRRAAGAARTIARLGSAVTFALVLLPRSASAQDDDAGQPPAVPDSVPAETSAGMRYYFYRPDVPYGSAGQFSPLSVLATRGFSTLSWSSSERHPLRIDWGSGWANVWDALAHPNATVQRAGGWADFAWQELGPVGWNVWEWAFAPNYAGHLVAGGITYRALTEWYDARGAPSPRVLGAATAMATILVNEAIESRNGTAGYASTTSDVYFFEPLGIALFSLDGVAGFFANTLHAEDWSPLASLTLPKLQLLNNSQLHSFHIGLPFVERADLLFVTGQGSQAGVLYDVAPEYSLGVAGGFTASSQLLSDTSQESLIAKAGGGLYLARRNSLLANLNVFRGGETLAVLNLYPGVLGGPVRDLGMWAMLNRGGDFSLGFSFRPMLGIGLGYDFWRVP
jgi:hypothetical protein